MTRNCRTSVLAAASAFALLSVLTACGSTVQLSGTGSATQLGAGSDNLGLGGDLPLTRDPAASTGEVNADASAAPGQTQPTEASASPDSSSGSTISPSSGSTATATTASIPARGKGWNEKTIYVGVMTQKDASVAYKAAGANGIDIGDTEAQAKAAAKVINASGGIFGRTISLVFRDVSTVSTALNPDDAGNASCTYFTEDHPVVAVVSILTIMDGAGWRSCLAQRGVALLSAALTAIDDTAISSVKPSYTPLAAPSWNALSALLMKRLEAQGWFGGWDAKLGRPGTAKPKFGVLVPDTPEGARTAKVIIGALSAAGHPGAISYRYQPPGNNIQPAVLYFAGNGVDHLISSNIELSTFMTSAENQRYRPRYGITTFNSPLANLASLAPAAQNQGAVGIGWAPNYDVSAANDPGVRGPGQQSCDTAMRAAGLNYKNKRLAGAFAYSICDGFQLLAQGAKAGKGLTAAAIRAGSVALGNRFANALSFGSALHAGSTFVPGTVRDISYVSSCSCYRYSVTRSSL